MDEIISELFAALNKVVLERIDATSFHLIGTPPNWFQQFFPEPATQQQRSDLERTFPFLENFLVDAECFWQSSDRGILKSGFWSEITSQQEYQLEAFAVCLNNKKILLIEQAEVAYQEQHSLIQIGREHQLSYDQLVKEIQKKEILLHCIFHDLAGQITTFYCCLDLLGLESLSDKGQERLAIGRTQLERQEELVRGIVQAFSAEIESIEKVATNSTEAPDLLACVQTVIKLYSPTFLVQRKQLQLAAQINPSEDWKVRGERSRLERILSNLIENALRYTPQDSTVQIHLQKEAEFIWCAVEDQGPGVPPQSVKYLFQRFFQAEKRTGKAGLGLYFCRMMVERWGGTIGYERLETGSRFWFRLPQFAQPENNSGNG